MKKFLLLFIVITLVPAACAPSAQPTVDSAAPTDEAVDLLADELIQLLSVNLGLDESAIVLISREDAEFGDACLEVARFDTACTQVVTPGYIFNFEANGIEYEYRTDAVGDSIQPATVAMTWIREGGIAGFCDHLTVYLSGEVYASSCRTQPNETSGYFSELLSAAQITEFNAWYQKFGVSRLDESDPAGVADRMVNTLEFFGGGTGKPGKVDQQALFAWAMALFQKLHS